METMDRKLIDRAEAAHAGKLSETDCRALYKELDAALKATNAEWEALDYRGDGEPNPARAEALASGDPQTIIEADRRQEQLEAQSELLHWHRERVSKAAQAAKVREAAPAARDAVKRLPAAVKALEKANAAQRDALAVVERLRTQLSTARHTAELAGVEVAGLTEEQHDALCRALGMLDPVDPNASYLAPSNRRLNVLEMARRLIGRRDPEAEPRVMSGEALQRDLEQRERRGYLAR